MRFSARFITANYRAASVVRNEQKTIIAQKERKKEENGTHKTNRNKRSFTLQKKKIEADKGLLIGYFNVKSKNDEPDNVRI